jgi:hypothetical protein
MKSTSKKNVKLSLNRESIRILDRSELAAAAGGIKPTKTTSMCPSWDVTLCYTACWLNCKA